MPVSCNALAKYLVMASQMIAWCTVSAMLLRRGMNQVTSTGGGDQHRGNATGTAEAVTGADQRVIGPDKQFDGNGTPAVVAGVVMIAIAAIMLVVSPTVMLIKMVEKRRRRVLDAELESPPKYEDVVESAPRYSSLFVFNNEGEMALLPENSDHAQERDVVQKSLV